MKTKKVIKNVIYLNNCKDDIYASSKEGFNFIDYSKSPNKRTFIEKINFVKNKKNNSENLFYELVDIIKITFHTENGFFTNTYNKDNSGEGNKISSSKINFF